MPNISIATDINSDSVNLPSWNTDGLVCLVTFKHGNKIDAYIDTDKAQHVPDTEKQMYRYVCKSRCFSYPPRTFIFFPAVFQE